MEKKEEQITLTREQVEHIIDLLFEAALHPSMYIRDGKDIILDAFKILRPFMDEDDVRQIQEEMDTMLGLWEQTGGKMEE